MKTKDSFGNSLNHKIMMSDLVGKSQQNEKTGIDIHFDRQIKVVRVR